MLAKAKANPIGSSNNRTSVNTKYMQYKPSLHLIFTSFDGHLYVVDGANGCVNKVHTYIHIYIHTYIHT